jgi:hypothetical protein
MNNASMRRTTVRPAWLAAAVIGTLVLAGTGPARAGETTFNGRIYADFTTKTNKDDATGAKSADTGTGTDVKRFYFQVGYKWDDVWSAHFTSDIGDFGTKRYDVFVKHAYIEGHFSPQFDFRMGSTDLPWIPYAEGAYGYRYVENVIVDRLGYGTSADWGLHANGGQGIFSYAVSVINGRGYSNPTRSKSPDVEARVSLKPTKQLSFAVGGYSGKLGKDVEGTDTFHTATRLNALVNYGGDKFHVGAEYFQAENYNTITTRGVTDKADGVSAWFSVPVNKTVEVFGRYDSAKPSKDLNPDLKDTYFNAGIQYSPGKNLDFAFAYKYEKVDSGTGGKVAGVGSTAANSTGKASEIGVWTQLRW